MQHANQIFSAQQDIVLCVPSGCTIFFTFIWQMAWFFF
jgi:hypothetical protein